MDVHLLFACLTFPPSLNTQSCDRRPLCSTLKFENLHSPKKDLKKKNLKKEYIKGIIQLFPKIWKKCSKSCSSAPNFFFQYWSGYPKSQKNINPLMQDWVYLLGFSPCCSTRKKNSFCPLKSQTVPKKNL